MVTTLINKLVMKKALIILLVVAGANGLQLLNLASDKTEIIENNSSVTMQLDQASYLSDSSNGTSPYLPQLNLKPSTLAPPPVVQTRNPTDSSTEPTEQHFDQATDTYNHDLLDLLNESTTEINDLIQTTEIIDWPVQPRTDVQEFDQSSDMIELSDTPSSNVGRLEKSPEIVDFSDAPSSNVGQLEPSPELVDIFNVSPEDINQVDHTTGFIGLLNIPPIVIKEMEKSTDSIDVPNIAPTNAHQLNLAPGTLPLQKDSSSDLIQFDQSSNNFLSTNIHSSDANQLDYTPELSETSQKPPTNELLLNQKLKTTPIMPLTMSMEQISRTILNASANRSDSTHNKFVPMVDAYPGDEYPRNKRCRVHIEKITFFCKVRVWYLGELPKVYNTFDLTPDILKPLLCPCQEGTISSTCPKIIKDKIGPFQHRFMCES